jgi:hypothetical protein
VAITPVDPKILSEEERSLVREQFDNTSVRLELLAQVIARIQGKAGNQVVSITVQFRDRPQQAALRTPTRTVLCVTYDDGSCGCLAEPPGICYPCPPGI